MPRGCQALWDVFLDLHASRGGNGFGPSAISAGDLLAWQTLNRVELTPWEIATLKALDQVALKAASAPPAETPST